jgi:hypothetical protein
MKKGRNAKLDNYKLCKVKYGTVDSKILKSVYLNIQTWAEPKVETENPNKMVGNLSKKIKSTTIENLNRDVFKDNIIIDVDLRSSGIQKNKKSFMNLECIFYLNSPIEDIKCNKLKNSILKVVDSLVHNILEKNETFEFSLTKK